MNNDRFDDLLSHHFAHQPANDAATARVMRRLAWPLPRQKSGLWKSLPNILLDWQFAPAWPRVAAFAGCAALGFAIGISGFDRSVDDRGSLFAISDRADLGSVVFEPEPLTGARP
jgi:hypothetical protein